MSLVRRLFEHRRKAQREGTSSGAARHLPQRGRQRGPLPSLTKNASIFRQIHLPLNRQLRCLGKALGWRFSLTNQILTTEQLPILTQIHTFCGGVEAAATTAIHTSEHNNNPAKITLTYYDVCLIIISKHVIRWFFTGIQFIRHEPL